MNGEHEASSATQNEAVGEIDAAYDALVGQARSALEASGELSPSQWVSVRAGIDEGVEASAGAHWAWIAAGVAAACALLVSFQPSLGTSAHSESAASEVAGSHGDVAPGSAAAGFAPTPAVKSYSVGQVVVAAQEAERLEAFGRHRLVLQPSSELEVLSWAPQDLSVQLRRGEVAAEIAKAYPGERVEILTETAAARVIGTQFKVALEESGATRVDVLEGVVEVSSRVDSDAAPVEVKAGKSHRVAARSDAPAKAVAPRNQRQTKRRPTPQAKDDGFRLIEIDVPPQKAPNAR